jgi:hypothetical protein
VCFWGYDNSREITFMVDDTLLRTLQPGLGTDERSVLGAFDEFREKVLQLANKQYVAGPQNRYSISWATALPRQCFLICQFPASRRALYSSKGGNAAWLLTAIRSATIACAAFKSKVAWIGLSSRRLLNGSVAGAAVMRAIVPAGWRSEHGFDAVVGQRPTCN